MKTIKELRLQVGMSQSQFSKHLNIPIRTLQDWEQGKRTPPDYVIELIKFRVEHVKACINRL